LLPDLITSVVKCGIGEKCLQGAPDVDRLPAVVAAESGIIDSMNPIFAGGGFALDSALV
jgi:hypothetical protein